MYRRIWAPSRKSWTRIAFASRKCNVLTMQTFDPTGMTMDDLLSRGKTLEAAFFYNSDRELLEKLRAEIKHDQAHVELAAVSGIEDEAVLEKLTEHDVTPASLAAVSLIPLVVVAWCDDEMESTEKEAILKAADASGILRDSSAYELLSSWLDERPHDDLFDAWKAYVSTLRSRLGDVALTQLKTSVMNRAETIADSAGGFLGFGSVSDKEKAAMEEIAKAFD